MPSVRRLHVEDQLGEMEIIIVEVDQCTDTIRHVTGERGRHGMQIRLTDRQLETISVDLKSSTASGN